MRRNCIFEINYAFVTGVVLMWAGVFARNVLEVEGLLYDAANFISGVGVGSVLVGLLYGSPKTRPLFFRLRAFKQRVLDRDKSE